MIGVQSLSTDAFTVLEHGRSVRKDLMLMEIDDHLLKEIQTNGGSLKGRDEDEAVLCTHTQTFALKHVQTTNTLLLISPLKDSNVRTPGKASVTARAEYHLEALLVAPRLEGLLNLLPEYQDEPCGAIEGGLQCSLSSGGDSSPRQNSSANQSSSGHQGHTLDQLLNRLQGSRAEVEAALKQVGAVEIDGKWFKLPPDLAAHLLQLLLLSCASNGWSLKAVPGTEAVVALCEDEVDPRLASHCLTLFGRRCEDDSSPPTKSPSQNLAVGASSTGTWMLEDHKVARHFTRLLLLERETWDLDGFLAALRAKLDEARAEDVAISEDNLKGEALVDRSTKSLRRFPEGELPVLPEERFNALWAAQPRWPAEDIEPYVESLQVPGQDSKALLLRYARKSQIGQEIFYSCRK